MAINEKDILNLLDNSNNYNSDFISLGNIMSYLIDCRINIFRNEKQQWAIVAERLGFSSRADSLALEIFYYGNCLINLSEQDGSPQNSFEISPIERGHLLELTKDDLGFNYNTNSITIRGEQISYKHDLSEYHKAGIELVEYEENMVNWEEVTRLLVYKNHEKFRATDIELYRCIPKDLNKILVLDEWHHKDYFEVSDYKKPTIADFEKRLRTMGIEEDTIKYLVKDQIRGEKNKVEIPEEKGEKPSNYETWNLIAKVISSGDISLYKPKLQPNSHWKYWEDSGSY